MPILTIDNQKIEVPAGTKVIEAAEQLGIMIPRFCYHPALGSVGACRVCAVAFTDGPLTGIQMSCMIDAQDDMVVSTTDAKAVDFRRHVIEWLMLHHPHDCPVCDEGGHCLLQDLTVAGGHGMRRYKGLKRTHHNQDLGPLVQHEMNRCIQCYRCSRYYQEFTGYRDLGVMGIGSRIYFGRSRSGVLESPFSGNLTDICPTGVYTDKPSRYTGRRWDYQRQSSVCLQCSLGCNLVASARYRKVLRHEARPNLRVNGYFICDRGRYGYAYASAADRPRQATANGAPGETASILAGAREAIREVIAHAGPDAVAMVTSSRCSLETLAAVKQVCERRAWTGPAVVATPRQALNLKTAVGCLQPELAISLTDVAEARDVLVVGADPLNEAPMLALALRQVQRRGGRITVIDPRGVQLPFTFDHWAIHPTKIGAVLQALVQQMDSSQAVSARLPTDFGKISARQVTALAKHINGSPRPVVVCGTEILTPGDISLAANLAQALGRTHKVTGLFYTLDGANAFAAALAHSQPIAVEQVVTHIEEGQLRALIVVESDLWQDYPERERLRAALAQLDQLVVMDYVASPLNELADHFMPTQSLYEAGGHWINQEGRLQAAQVVLAGGESIDVSGGLDHPPRVFGSHIPGGEPIAAWQAVMALAADAETESGPTPSQALVTAMKDFHPAVAALTAGGQDQRIDLAASSNSASGSSADPEAMESDPADTRIALLLVDWTFGTEPLSAMAPALRQVTPLPVARLHPETVSRLKLADDEPVTVTTDKGTFTLPLQADANMAPGVMVIPRHHQLDWQIVGDTRVTVASSQLTAAK